MANSRKMKTSNLWNCFKDVGDSVNKVAICKLCKVKLSYKSSTSNLKKYLDRKHPPVQFLSTRQQSVQSVPVAPTTLESNPQIPQSPSDSTMASTSSANVQLLQTSINVPTMSTTNSNMTNALGNTNIHNVNSYILLHL